MNKNKQVEVSPEIRAYTLRTNKIDDGDAMDALIEIYLDNCGISLTDRTLAENAIHFWIERWKKRHTGLSKHAGLYEIMALRSERYCIGKEFYDRYDVTCIDAEDTLHYCREMMRDYDDDLTRISLCAGILYWHGIEI
ncbi:MAG: hypothetical protein NC453_18525 [Muribaculum sp.]|nr:hypothetical protein [Muribaculum sp.]